MEHFSPSELHTQTQCDIPRQEHSSFSLGQLVNVETGTNDAATSLVIENTMNSAGTKWLSSTNSTVGASPTGASPTTGVNFVVCYTCGKRISGNTEELKYLLSQHARAWQHGAFRCAVTACDKYFSDYRERDAHQRRPHVTGHGRVATTTSNDCQECKSTLKSKADLLRHANEHQHQPYACECGTMFSRLDVLNRHLDSFSTEVPKYPCRFCRRHRGVDGFKRRDHLMQHIRNYDHHEIDNAPFQEDYQNPRLQYAFPVCPHSDCPQFRNEAFKKLSRSAQEKDKPFPSQSAFTKHMRDEHNECTFPCDVAGCNRIGRRGYFREKDLMKHHREQHPDALPYEFAKRETRHKCLEDGCKAILDPSSLYWHYLSIHKHGIEIIGQYTNLPQD